MNKILAYSCIISCLLESVAKISCIANYFTKFFIDTGVLGGVPLGEGVESNGVRTRGTTEQGEYRSHARMAMIEPISWDLIEEKVQPSPSPPTQSVLI